MNNIKKVDYMDDIIRIILKEAIKSIDPIKLHRLNNELKPLGFYIVKTKTGDLDYNDPQNTGGSND